MYQGRVQLLKGTRKGLCSFVPNKDSQVRSERDLRPLEGQSWGVWEWETPASFFSPRNVKSGLILLEDLLAASEKVHGELSYTLIGRAGGGTFNKDFLVAC